MINYLKKIIFILSESQLKLAFLVLEFFLASFLEASSIGFIGPFISMVSDPSRIDNILILSKIKEISGLNNNNQFILLTGIILILFFILKTIAQIAIKGHLYTFSYAQGWRLGMRLFNTYIRASYEFYLSFSSATMLNRILVESTQFTTACVIPLLESASSLLLLTGLVILLARTNLNLVLLTLAVALPISGIYFLLSDRFKQWGKRISHINTEAIKTITHGMGGLKEVKVIGCEQYFQDQVASFGNEAARLNRNFAVVQFLPRSLIEALIIISTVGYLTVASSSNNLDLNNALSTMGVFIIASLRLVPIVSLLNTSFGSLKNASYIVDTIYLTLKEIEKPLTQTHLQQQAPRSQPINLQFKDQIEIKNINYQYNNTSKNALENISLELRKGESIAFIGKSGAGKTTLVDILLGLLLPKSGDILVDGHSIYDHLDSWKHLIGYIPQSIFLADDTIARNIAFGVPDSQIDWDRIEAAIQAAQISEFIQQLEQGLNTGIGERGVRLSGGQRQRIGISRALYHQREILVLDEATSALDNETEEKVSDSINALAGTKTLILIAHRLTTLKKCDRIYVLEHGRIVNVGSYDEIVQPTQ